MVVRLRIIRNGDFKTSILSRGLKNAQKEHNDRCFQKNPKTILLVTLTFHKNVFESKSQRSKLCFWIIK